MGGFGPLPFLQTPFHSELNLLDADRHSLLHFTRGATRQATLDRVKGSAAKRPELAGLAGQMVDLRTPTLMLQGLANDEKRAKERSLS